MCVAYTRASRSGTNSSSGGGGGGDGDDGACVLLVHVIYCSSFSFTSTH